VKFRGWYIEYEKMTRTWWEIATFKEPTQIVICVWRWMLSISRFPPPVSSRFFHGVDTYVDLARARALMRETP